MHLKENVALQIPKKVESLRRRMGEYVKVGSPDECWEWIAKARNAKGYGHISAGRAFKFKAHRVAWALANGPIPDSGHVLHRCDNPSCCNPNHLFLGSKKENTHDMMAKGRMKKPPTHWGEAHHMAKFDLATAIKISKDPRTARVIAEEYGVCTQTVYRLKRGETWREKSTKLA